MIKVYAFSTPNSIRVPIAMEELALPYELVSVNVRKGEQKLAPHMALNPNGKVPVIVDGDATVFDSNAILLYLAEKTGKFLPENTPRARGELLSWLMFIATGVGPFSGQAVHFTHHAPEKLHYATNRYQFEVKRHYAILDSRLANHRYMLGDAYTIVDMDLWGWARLVPFILGGDPWPAFPNVKRLLDEIAARPAVGRAEALKERHSFKAELDDDARKHMFPQNATLAA